MAETKSRAEVWVTLSTLLAAIAACASAYAAFRQERATFTSALYSKQVDAVGSYLSLGKQLGDALGDVVISYRSYLKGPSDPKLKADVATAADKVYATTTSFQTLTAINGLLMPKGYKATMDAMLQMAFLIEANVQNAVANLQANSSSTKDTSLVQAATARADFGSELG